MATATSFTIPGPAGALECLLALPSGAPRLAAAICHPHPLYGGTMHNQVVHALASALANAGAVTMRFQFRGVGLSAGVHDGGLGECDDLTTIIDHLTADYPGLPLLVAGYSFGAWVGLRVGARDDRVTRLAGVGLATTLHRFEELHGSTKTKLLVQGTRDAFGPIDEVRQLHDELEEPKRLVEIEGADHFFSGQQQAIERALREALS